MMKLYIIILLISGTLFRQRSIINNIFSSEMKVVEEYNKNNLFTEYDFIKAHHFLNDFCVTNKPQFTDYGSYNSIGINLIDYRKNMKIWKKKFPQQHQNFINILDENSRLTIVLQNNIIKDTVLLEINNQPIEVKGVILDSLNSHIFYNKIYEFIPYNDTLTIVKETLIKKTSDNYFILEQKKEKLNLNISNIFKDLFFEVKRKKEKKTYVLDNYFYHYPVNKILFIGSINIWNEIYILRSF